jgi:hypothetical protein
MHTDMQIRTIARYLLLSEVDVYKSSLQRLPFIWTHNSRDPFIGTLFSVQFPRTKENKR